MKRAAVYMRVSTSEQNTEAQRAELLELVAARGYEPIEFTEIESARKKRPELEHVLELARRGQIRAVFVWALDRLSRSMKGTIETVLELDRLRVRVVSLKEPWLDTDGPTRNLLIPIFGWVAEQELERLRERTKAGMELARRKGKQIGRPRKELDVHKVAHVARTQGIRFAAASFGVARGTVRRMIREHDAIASSSSTGPLFSSSSSSSSSEPRRIALVSCGKSKKSFATRASLLYTGELFRKSLEVARDVEGLETFILSAKHGLVDPATELEPYDLTLTELTKAERSAWAGRVANALDRRFPGERLELALFAGAAYVDPIRIEIGRRGWLMDDVLGGLQIGERLRRLNELGATSGDES